MRLLALIFALMAIPLAAREVPVCLEMAATPQSREWGLMGRSSLPESHGMLFVFPQPKRHMFWMFNCFVDLSLAVLSDEGAILEIHELKAYPYMMDARRPVQRPADFAKYSIDDPICLFFSDHAAYTQRPARLLLEMPGGWFDRQGVRLGDQLQFNPSTGQGHFTTN